MDHPPQSAPTHMQADSRLHALGARLNAVPGLDAELRDNELRVTRGDRTETIMCKPRQADGGKLWFWDSRREPLEEAGHVTDAAVRINGRLQDMP